MGSSLSPVIANIFLSHFEKRFLDTCLLEFKPSFYRRYLDDTFLIFSNVDQAKTFFDYFNSKHQNIKFTFEGEENKVLSFLDVSIHRSQNCFSTSIFRKKTFTGLGLNYFSNIFYDYMKSIIHTLLNRAFVICSDYYNLHREIDFLRKYFEDNFYPRKLFDLVLKKFLDSKFIIKEQVSTVRRQDVYLELPWIGKQSKKMRTDLQQLFSSFYPQLKPNFYYRNNFSIGSFFRNSDRKEALMQSHVVYKYTCHCCQQCYIGSTSVQLFKRCAQHLGVSFRTGQHSTRPDNSSIRDHSEKYEHVMKESNFSILDRCNTERELRILESIHIFKHRPSINECQFAVPLNILA